MTKHSYFPYTSTYISTRHNTNKNTTCIIPLIQTYSIRQHSKAQKPTIFNNVRCTTNIPTYPHTITTTDIKTNLHHIHTSIVSRHLATSGNNKILRTSPPHIISSEEMLHRITRRTLAQLRTNKSPFLKSYLQKVDAKSHPSPLCPLCNTHTHGHTSSLQLLPHTHHIVTPGFVDRPRRSDCTAGQMDGEASWCTTCGNIGLPPLARVMGVGRHQPPPHQQNNIVYNEHFCIELNTLIRLGGIYSI